MKRVIVSDKEAVALATRERKRIESYRRKHARKKRSYAKDTRYSSIMRSLEISFNPYLFAIQFRSSLSMYLFLYLKNEATKTKPPDKYGIPQIYSVRYFTFPVQIKFAKIARVLGFSRNSVKAAYKELLNMGLIMDTSEEFFPDHLGTKTCILYNDEYIIHYDRNQRKVHYSYNKS